LGIAIKDLGLPDQCVIAAIIRGGKVIVPSGATVFKPEDEVLAVTNQDGARRLAELFAPPGR
ncbi:MAG: potassium transporter TrkA, partial [Anaerolinea sp.]|nr:potassium transporter TrkA [Anaerolinea sp.]